MSQQELAQKEDLVQIYLPSAIDAPEHITDVTIPPLRRFLFTLNDLGMTLSTFFVSAFLVVYFTNVALIPMASISLLLLLGRFWDAITDPLIGRFLDRSERKERYRPWVVMGNVGSALLVLVLYFIRPEWSEQTRIIYLWVFYSLWVVFNTIGTMAYRAFCGVVTTNGMERAKLGSMRGMLIGVAAALPGIIAPPLIILFGGHELSREGYLITLLIFTVVAFPMITAAPLSLKERVRKPIGQKIPLKDSLECIYKNGPMMFSVLGAFMFGLLIFGRFAFLFHFMQYNMGNSLYFAYVSTVSVVCSFLGAAIVPYIYRLVKNKGRVCAIGLLLAGVSNGVTYLFGGDSLVFVLVGLGFVFIGATLFSAMNIALIGDAADNAELKFGIRVDGFLNASFSMSQKVGGAISPALGAALLASAGFVAGAEVQSPEVMNVLNFNVLGLPAIFCFIAGIAFLFYRFGDKEHNEVVAQLEEMRRERSLPLNDNGIEGKVESEAE